MCVRERERDRDRDREKERKRQTNRQTKRQTPDFKTVLNEIEVLDRAYSSNLSLIQLYQTCNI